MHVSEFPQAASQYTTRHHHHIKVQIVGQFLNVRYAWVSHAVLSHDTHLLLLVAEDGLLT